MLTYADVCGRILTLLALGNVHAEQCEALGGEVPTECKPPRLEWSLERAEVLAYVRIRPHTCLEASLRF
jgi:hypothetical protein